MTDFILPDIGEGIVECEILQWKVSEGDAIKEDQVVAEVMTDKATVEIPAMHSGTVSKLYYKEGDIAKVHAPLFAMDSANDASISESQSLNNVSSSKAESTDDRPEQSFETTQHKGKTELSESGQIESFILPDIGEGIVECEIMQWHIKEGDLVSEDQVVVEVMTDKAIVEIPAKHPGKIVKLHYQKGDIAAVHSKLFDQALQDDVQSAKTPSHGSHMSSSPNQKASSDNIDQAKQGENFTPPLDIGKAIASPAVRRLARENNIDLANVKASGAKGRVLKADVLNSIENARVKRNEHRQNAVSTSNADAKSVTGSPNQEKSDNDRVEAIKGIRAAMAKQMVASVSTIPHFSVSDELCMDNLIRLREDLKQSFAKKDQKLSYMPFFVKALSLAMQSYPIVNSRLNDEATELTYLGAHNIGVAVDSKSGLLVPNIKHVESKSLFDVALEFNQLVTKARDGKLSNQDLSNTTISISNVGAIGGITATPIINKPNVAIVALGKTQKLPRFRANGEVFASNIMSVNWSADHRVIDGATMVKFNNLWTDYLANPEKMLMYLR